MSITKRKNREIAEYLASLSQDDLLEVIMYCDLNISEYTFSFNLIKSLIDSIKDDGDYTTKNEIWKRIEAAKSLKI